MPNPGKRQPPLEVRMRSAEASRRRYPEKARARNKIRRAVYQGHVTRPEACERCGAPGAVEASHDDYARPLDVEWLCRPCHCTKDLVTHCRNGHEYTPENTYTAPGSGFRRCRECGRADRAKYRAKKKATSRG